MAAIPENSSRDEVLSTLGATVQIAKRNELHRFEVIPQRWIVGAILRLAGEMPQAMEELRA